MKSSLQPSIAALGPKQQSERHRLIGARPESFANYTGERPSSLNQSMSSARPPPPSVGRPAACTKQPQQSCRILRLRHAAFFIKHIGRPCHCRCQIRIDVIEIDLTFRRLSRPAIENRQKRFALHFIFLLHTKMDARQNQDDSLLTSRNQLHTLPRACGLFDLSP